MRPAYSSFFVFYVNECTKAGNYGKLFHRNNERMYAHYSYETVYHNFLLLCTRSHKKQKKELYAGRISSLLCILFLYLSSFPLSFCFD